MNITDSAEASRPAARRRWYHVQFCKPCCERTEKRRKKTTFIFFVRLTSQSRDWLSTSALPYPQTPSRPQRRLALSPTSQSSVQTNTKESVPAECLCTRCLSRAIAKKKDLRSPGVSFRVFLLATEPLASVDPLSRPMQCPSGPPWGPNAYVHLGNNVKSIRPENQSMLMRLSMRRMHRCLCRKERLPSTVDRPIREIKLLSMKGEKKGK